MQRSRTGRRRRSTGAATLAASALLAGIVIGIPAVSPATTWVVHANGSGDAPTIQAAVNLAAAGDTVLVTAGTYTDVHMDAGGEFAAVEMKSGVVLRSQDGSGSTVIDVTSDDVARGIVCRDCGGGTAIEGFTITGGDTFAGAGILIDGGAPRISDNLFFDAYGGMGGGIHVTSGATPEIIGNVFDANEACCGPGGAILIDADSAPEVLGNTFTGNSAFGGGAVAIQNASGFIEGNEFTGNAGTEGGALSVWAGSPVIRDNVFAGNESSSGGGAVAFRISGEATFHDNLVVGNTADGSGGGILVSAASPSIARTTVAGNSAAQGGGIAITDSAEPAFEGVIVAMNVGNGGVLCEDAGSSPTFSCMNVFGNEGDGYAGQCADPTGLDGNISTDPLFCNATAGDYSLCDISPCAPGNHPDGSDCGRIGALGTACVCEPTAVEEATWGSIKALFR